MGAVGAGVSVVSGLVGLQQQRKAANAQKQALASQQEQQALQARLNYLSLTQQAYADSINDVITDATKKLAYSQTEAQLFAQEKLNDIGVQNALLEANTNKALASISKDASDTEATQTRMAKDIEAGQQTLAVGSSADEALGSQAESLLKMLSGGKNQQEQIANLLDAAAAGGGVNLALENLLGEGAYDAIVAAGEQQRLIGTQDARLAAAGGQEEANKKLNSANEKVSLGMNQLGKAQADYGADKQILDAKFSQAINKQGFAATAAANKASYNIGLFSDQSSRASRDYLRQQNLDAVLRGAQLNSEILKAQSNAVSSPGFFDYLGVGLSGYQQYKATLPQPAPKVQYATK